MSHRSLPVVGPVLLALLVGCGTTRQTDTARTATEMLLVSNAIDESVGRFDFAVLRGQKVFFDAQYLDGCVDKGYVVSSIRQHLLASGVMLQEDRNKATYVVEARSGAVGTDRHQLLVGIPQMSVPAIVPGQPSQIPEIPFAKKTDQQGVAKLAVFAYNRLNGEAVWQSGVVESTSAAKDTWVLGAGPFRNGTIRRGTEFAGQQLPELMVWGGETEEEPPPVALTRGAVWVRPPEKVDQGPIVPASASTPAAPPPPPPGPPAPPSVETKPTNPAENAPVAAAGPLIDSWLKFKARGSNR